MSNASSLPPSSPYSQPESNDRIAAGNEWNNGITRRSFLKRTGGATLATMVTWHGMTLDSSAAGTGVAGESAKHPKKQKYIVKKGPLDGGQIGPYTQAQLDKMGKDWWDGYPIPTPQYQTPNPFLSAPTIPTAAQTMAGPTDMEPQVDYETVVDKIERVPEYPKAVENYKNPQDGKYYAIFKYEIHVTYKKKE